MIDKQLSHYRLLESLGKGGMGEVFSAEDSKLRRRVAVKVLPAEVATDEERLARFEREAQLLASLNHPNIAAIYGLETQEDRPFLVMELVEGETLQQRIARGPLGLEEVLDVFSQIAEGLQAAHETGVVHRDLKPANIKISPQGVVKILDFGLAKAFENPSPELSNSPTLNFGTTQAGVILGTAAYMSPEQAKSKPVDRAGDVWAFGCVLFEALAGRQAFEGESVTEILATVLRGEPAWDALPPGVPAGLRSLLRICLKKEPSERFRDIRDVRIQLVNTLSEPPEEGPLAVPAADGEASRRRALSWGLVGLLAGVLAATVVWNLLSGSTPVGPGVQRFHIDAQQLGLFGIASSVSVSPDGRRIVFQDGDQRQLYQRRLDQVEALPLDGTEGAEGPFFSPQGQWLGFWADDKLKKMSLSGGRPQTICDAEYGVIGASWGSDGNIYYSAPRADGPPSLWKVSSAGGQPELLLTAPQENGEDHVLLWPQVLPGSEAVLFTNFPFEPVAEEGRIQVLSLDGNDSPHRTLAEGAFYGRYADTGHLVAAWPGGLVAIPFDVGRLETTGPQVPIVDDLHFEDAFVPHYDFSREGTLVYVSGSSRGSRNRLLWMDRDGERSEATSDSKGFMDPRLSPDGRQIAVAIAEEGQRSIWIYDASRGTPLKPITFEGFATVPVWGPEGLRLAYSSSRGGPQRTLYSQPIDGSARARTLWEGTHGLQAASWTPDGSALIFEQLPRRGNTDIWVLDGLNANPEPRAFLQTPFDEAEPRLSPNGEWLAYQSDQSGTTEVYIRPFPGPGAETLVSSGGGTRPVWGGDEEILFHSRNRLMSARVRIHSNLQVDEPIPLVEGLHSQERVHDITPDRGRFLVLRSESRNQPTRLLTVVNWFQELRNRVGTGQ